MLELVSFLCGAAVMVLEMAGARLLAPYLGTSFIVWTALIGVILASLSAGYWLGGKFSDKYPRAGALGGIVLAAACLTALVALLGGNVLAAVAESGMRLHSAAIIAAIALFCPAGVLLGMVSPSIIKVKLIVDQVEQSRSGAIIGRFFALSTIGSIVGTFLGGYVLISIMGTRWILFCVAAALLLSAIILFRADTKQTALRRGKPNEKRRGKILAAVLLCAACAGGAAWSEQLGATAGKVEINTPYTTIQVVESGVGEMTYRYMITSPGKFQSAVRLAAPDVLAGSYTRYFSLTELYQPAPGRVLMLGGGGYTVPRHMLYERDKAAGAPGLTDMRIDVAEIDPGITQAARDYFFLQDDPRLHIFHEDARIFLNHTARESAKNQNTPRYDVILVDTFNSHYAIPFHMCTREAMQALYDLLADDGVVAMNIIGSIHGDAGRLFRAIHATAAEIFPDLRVFMVHTKDLGTVQNLMLLASKSVPGAAGTLQTTGLRRPAWHRYLASEYKEIIPHDMPVLTDDFAPVERYAIYD